MLIIIIEMIKKDKIVVRIDPNNFLRKFNMGFFICVLQIYLFFSDK
jgi:hypothetical protein